MALLPGNLLLISSHFIPLPRRSMIRASSSADHLDCFLAGDSSEWDGCGRLVGTEVVVTEVVVTAVAVVLGAVTEDADLDEACGDGASSSFGLRRSEISTLPAGYLGMQSICATQTGAGRW